MFGDFIWFLDDSKLVKLCDYILYYIKPIFKNVTRNKIFSYFGFYICMIILSYGIDKFTVNNGSLFKISCLSISIGCLLFVILGMRR